MQEYLSWFLQPETLTLLWTDLKIEGIDFTEPFVWIDDEVYPEELGVLRLHDAENSLMLVDLAVNPEQLLHLKISLGY